MLHSTTRWMYSVLKTCCLFEKCLDSRSCDAYHHLSPVWTAPGAGYRFSRMAYLFCVGFKSGNLSVEQFLWWARYVDILTPCFEPGKNSASLKIATRNGGALTWALHSRCANIHNSLMNVHHLSWAGLRERTFSKGSIHTSKVASENLRPAFKSFLD